MSACRGQRSTLGRGNERIHFPMQYQRRAADPRQFPLVIEAVAHKQACRHEWELQLDHIDHAGESGNKDEGGDPVLHSHFGGDPRSKRVAHNDYLRALNAMVHEPLKCSSAVVVQSFLTGRSGIPGIASILRQEQAVSSSGEGLGCYSATRVGVAVTVEKDDRRLPIPSGPINCTQNEPIGRPEADHFRIGERI